MTRLRSYQTEAIVLKRMDFGEADRLLTVVTPGYGKLRVLAKGVRRTTSRLSGHLESFSLVHLMLARGRNLDVVVQAMMLEPFRHIRDDLSVASYAYHLGELVETVSPEGQSDGIAFGLFRSALAALDQGLVEPDLTTRYFEVQLLDAAGFRPQLLTCLGCGVAIAPIANWFSIPMGGVYCPSCGAREPSARAISVDGLKYLRYLQRTPSVEQVSIRPPSAVANEVERLLRSLIEAVLERRLRAVEFVKRVAEERAVYAP